MTEQWDLRPIYDLLLAYDHRFATKDLHVPRMWVNEGCDPLLDCVPTIEGILAWARRTGRTITSFQYFTKPIREARDKRMRQAVAKQPEPAELEEKKAKHIALVTRKYGRRMPYEERWLAGYEAKHGPVDISA